MAACCDNYLPHRTRIENWRDGWVIVSDCGSCGARRRESPFFDLRERAEVWLIHNGQAFKPERRLG